MSVLSGFFMAWPHQPHRHGKSAETFCLGAFSLLETGDGPISLQFFDSGALSPVMKDQPNGSLSAVTFLSAVNIHRIDCMKEFEVRGLVFVLSFFFHTRYVAAVIMIQVVSEVFYILQDRILPCSAV